MLVDVRDTRPDGRPATEQSEAEQAPPRRSTPTYAPHPRCLEDEAKALFSTYRFQQRDNVWGVKVGSLRGLSLCPSSAVKLPRGGAVLAAIYPKVRQVSVGEDLTFRRAPASHDVWRAHPAAVASTSGYSVGPGEKEEIARPPPSSNPPITIHVSSLFVGHHRLVPLGSC